jgi:hypothetical protein
MKGAAVAGDLKLKSRSEEQKEGVGSGLKFRDVACVEYASDD